MGKVAKGKGKKTTDSTLSQIAETTASLKKDHSGDRDGGVDTNAMNVQLWQSGTSLISGFLTEDENQELSGIEWMRKFDLMRRTDATVSAILQAIELPIRSTLWRMKPAADEETGEIDERAWEISDFVEENLFKKLDKPWDNLLKEICTMFPFGFSLFEIVWGADEEGNIIIKKIAFRKQTTIMAWETSDGLPGVQQILPSGVVGWPNDGQTNVDIPADKLLLFTNQREGDNYEGISVLRPCYKHWFFKDNLYRFDGIRHEKQSTGVPVMYLWEGATDKDKEAALQIVKNIRSSDQMGIVCPWPKTKGWDFGFADLHASDSTNLFESIKHHNREICKSVLAQFLELWDTQSGSRALSEDQSDLFLLCIISHAKNIADTFNRYIIPKLVDYNFDGVTEYPTLEFDKIGTADMEKFANIISTLIGAEALHPDENIEDHFRKVLWLPARETGVSENSPGDGTNEDPEQTDPNNPDQNGDPLDELQSQLDDLENTDGEFDDVEFDSIFNDLTDAMEFALDEWMEFVAKGGHLTDAHKKAISEALTKAGGSTLQTARKWLTKRISESTDSIEKQNADFQARTDGLRNEIANLKKMKDSTPLGKAGTAQRKKLAAALKTINAKIAAMRDERNQITTPLKSLRTQDIQTRRQVVAVIKERKAAIVEETKRIRAELQSGKISLDNAIEPMRKQVAANNAQTAELRAAIKELPKWDPKKDAMNVMIQGLIRENTQSRTTQASLRSDFANTKKAKSQEIQNKRASSGLYHEHPEGEEHHDHHHEKVGDDMVFDEDYLALSKQFNNGFIIKLQNECTSETYADLKKKGFRKNEFEEKAFRPLTFAERKVNFGSIGWAMDSFSKILTDKMEGIAEKQKKDILAQIKTAIDANDIEAVGKISMKYSGELAAALTNIQKEMFEIGKKTAATEMTVMVPPTAREVSGAIRVQNDAVIDGMMSRAEVAAKTAVTGIISKKGGAISATTSSEAVGAAAEALDKVFVSSLATLNTLGITGAINLWRSSIFEKYPEKIYGFQFSAILDARTTRICQSLDGRVVPAGSSDFYDYSPPRHFNCRSIWVEILMEETFKPKFTGIPSSIPANSTIDTFKDLKAPVILKNSPAIKVIEQEIEQRKEKLKALQDSNTFPNRQKQHQDKIDQLESSLKSASDAAFNEYIHEILKADWIVFVSETPVSE